MMNGLSLGRDVFLTFEQKIVEILNTYEWNLEAHDGPLWYLRYDVIFPLKMIF